MVKHSQKYFKEREAAWQKQQIKLDGKREKEIVKRLQDMQDAIQTQIDANWQNFAGSQGISIAEAYKQSKKMDIQAFARKAKKYVKEKDFSERANKELKVYNVTMRVNRLELMKANIGLELISSFDEIDKYMSDKLSEGAIEEYRRQAGILGIDVKDSDYKSLANSVIDGSFKVKDYPTFSDNLWSHQTDLKSDLDKLLMRGITLGRNPKTLAGELSAYLTEQGRANTRYNLNRLLITEMGITQTLVQKKAFLEFGEDELYDVMPEPTACDLCLEIARKGPYPVKKMTPGVNAPALHPFCRCSTAISLDV